MATFGYFHRTGIELIICKQSEISYPLHNHVSVFTFGFILDGAIELTTDKGSRLYQKNEAFLILPYTPHCINAKSRYTLLSLCINAEWASGLEIEELNSAVTSFLHEAINNLETEKRIQQIFFGFLMICRMIPTPKRTGISEIKTKLERYPERRYTIEEMAKAVHVSKYSFIRIFRNEVGLTPHQFQIQNRIRKAQRLLEGTIETSEAALVTGFFDQSHFIRHFVKLVGLTPTGYRLACNAALPMPVD